MLKFLLFINMIIFINCNGIRGSTRSPNDLKREREYFEEQVQSKVKVNDAEDLPLLTAGELEVFISGINQSISKRLSLKSDETVIKDLITLRDTLELRLRTKLFLPERPDKKSNGIMTKKNRGF